MGAKINVPPVSLPFFCFALPSDKKRERIESKKGGLWEG